MTIPVDTKIAPKGFYLLGLSKSALAVPAKKGDTVLHVWSVEGMKVGDTIEIGTGAGMETGKITSLGTAAGNHTTIWQPLPDGPVITLPVGSTSVPVQSVGGGGRGPQGGPPAAPLFNVGQKIGIGHGATYPVIGTAREQYEIVTVTAVGKPGTQAWLSKDAKAGDTNIKVSSVANITAGDKIRLDIDSVGHGVETVTVTNVGTQSARNTFGGPLREDENAGTGLELAEPLKFNHASNMPFSVNGTGISFQPATAFAHSSNEPVLPLGTGITLESPLANDHPIHAAVRDAAVKSAGYQGTQTPHQWFGGPAFTNAGSIVLQDAAGMTVDSLNFGLIVDPWTAEGYQGRSPGNGCTAPAPGGRGGFGGFGGRPGGPVAAAPNRSVGRAQDDVDTDSNCTDFVLQTATNLALDSAADAINVKVASVAEFTAGQTVYVDTGANRETAVIATVGTAGASTIGAATEAGVTVIPVANAAGFAVGQTITVDSGPNSETVVVAFVRGGGGRGGPGGGRGGAGAPGASITLNGPLDKAHAVGAQVAGTGLTFTAALTKPHANGAQLAGHVPTPGEPNQYPAKRQ